MDEYVDATSSSANDAFDAYQCPECGNIQETQADCENCTFGAEEEGWMPVKVVETKDGQLVKV